MFTHFVKWFNLSDIKGGEIMSAHNRIKKLRKEKGLSQKEFAKAFNEFSKDDENVKSISYATVSRWENGENEPKLETWIKIADFFDVPVSYLQGTSDDKNTYEFKNIVQLKNVLEKGMDIKSEKNLKIGGLTFESTKNKKEANQNFTKNVLSVVSSSAELKLLVGAYAPMKDNPIYQNSVQELNTFLVSLVMFITNGMDERQLQQVLLDFIDAFKADEQDNKLDKD